MIRKEYRNYKYSKLKAQPDCTGSVILDFGDNRIIRLPRNNNVNIEYRESDAPNSRIRYLNLQRPDLRYGCDADVIQNVESAKVLDPDGEIRFLSRGGSYVDFNRLEKEKTVRYSNYDETGELKELTATINKQTFPNGVSLISHPRLRLYITPDRKLAFMCDIVWNPRHKKYEERTFCETIYKHESGLGIIQSISPVENIEERIPSIVSKRYEWIDNAFEATN